MRLSGDSTVRQSFRGSGEGNFDAKEIEIDSSELRLQLEIGGTGGMDEMTEQLRGMSVAGAPAQDPEGKSARR